MIKQCMRCFTMKKIRGKKIICKKCEIELDKIRLEFRKRGSTCVGPLMPISTHSESWFLAPFWNWKQTLDNVELL